MWKELSVQMQIKVKIHMSYVITFDIWQRLYHEQIYNIRKFQDLDFFI